MDRKTILVLILLGFPLYASAMQRTIKAFPQAEGFGAYSQGGRGGQVIFVTNLLDYTESESPIPGSLRFACETPGPRTIIFRVSGLIELKTQLVISEPYLTLAGQTAPGNGICIKNYGVAVIGSHDIIIRYMRFRPGDKVGRMWSQKGKHWATDALTVSRSRHIMIDHCSTSWANDEVLSLSSKVDSTTVQWCFITESLTHSTHPKGRHGYGGLVAYICDGRISQHHNLWAYHFSRCPRPGSGADCDGSGLLYDFRNNVIVKGGRGYSVEGRDKIRMNYIGNYILDSIPFATTSGLEMYQSGNLHDRKNSGWQMFLGKCQKKKQPFQVAHIHTDLAEVAFDRVLHFAGACLPVRDRVDSRIVEQILQGGGQLIDSPSAVGGWPHYNSGIPPIDFDSDGMSDEWEIRYGLDSRSADHNLDSDMDGYTHIEEYLNQTHPHISNP
ncbi:pectate lyase [candidate division KSB1 bacterium]|nr:pectate lyase [candidate division KSB1 bacterium]